MLVGLLGLVAVAMSSSLPCYAAGPVNGFLVSIWSFVGAPLVVTITCYVATCFIVGSSAQGVVLRTRRGRLRLVLSCLWRSPPTLYTQ